ncbi:hypothetical protein [Mucilaginibacter ginkgonis]|uniref:Uncharacterized protein n=1 Tax=Mucilaginibacter ginkgonis TaxID=2682091 RepID=A0A6I4I3K6_9SPHI|nr:hypothetical protein [Mucilaginibacter ginkgonis]QQL48540.1 hypothetical protein GO620_010085 [Mucilaginibacter ginkgonis]
MVNLNFKKALKLTTLILLSVNICVFAQDTTRKTGAKPKTIAKPVATPPANKYPAKPAITVPKTASPAPATTTPAANPYAAPAPAPTDRSINGQYQYLLTKLYNYQRPMASAFYKSVSDSLHSVQKRIKPLESNVAALQDTAKELHKQLAGQQEELNKSTSQQDSISLAGIPMTKSSYNMLMWGLVVVFGVIAVVVITRSGAYAREAKNRVQAYEELEEEHKNYKAKAGEKEKKLARELQTARNKLEELTGNPNY